MKINEQWSKTHLYQTNSNSMELSSTGYSYSLFYLKDNRAIRENRTEERGSMQPDSETWSGPARAPTWLGSERECECDGESGSGARAKHTKRLANPVGLISDSTLAMAGSRRRCAYTASTIASIVRDLTWTEGRAEEGSVNAYNRGFINYKYGTHHIVMSTSAKPLNKERQTDYSTLWPAKLSHVINYKASEQMSSNNNATELMHVLSEPRVHIAIQFCRSVLMTDDMPENAEKLIESRVN